jgi:hypothetical protein
MTADHLHLPRGAPDDCLVPFIEEEAANEVEEVWVRAIGRWWPTTWWIWLSAIMTEPRLQDRLQWWQPWQRWTPSGAILELQDGLCGASPPSVSLVGAGALPTRVVPWPWSLELALLTLRLELMSRWWLRVNLSCNLDHGTAVSFLRHPSERHHDHEPSRAGILSVAAERIRAEHITTVSM